MRPGILPETPVLQPLRRVSPSRFFSLKECALREIWSASRQESLLPPSPAAQLGTVIHRLLEAAGKGTLNAGNPADIENIWQKLVERTEQGMLQSWLQRSLVPLRGTIPQFQVRKIRACKKAAEVARAAGRYTEYPGTERLDRFESWIETPDGLVAGSIDQIQETKNGAILRDYKSGYIIEKKPEDAISEVEEKYKLQLKLYAALFASKQGRWPIKLEVVPLQGPEKDIPFEPAECESLLREATYTLKQVNDQIGQALKLSDPEKAAVSFANPSPASCRNCCFRPSCKAYQTARNNLSQNRDWPRDVWGSVCEFKLLGNQKVALAVKMSSRPEKPIRIRGLASNADRHPALEFMREGERIAVYNLKGQIEGCEFVETLSTVIYLVPESPLSVRGTLEP